MRGGLKTDTIFAMTNDEHDLTPDLEPGESSVEDDSRDVPLRAGDLPDDDLRYAPPDLRPFALEPESPAESFEMSDSGSLDIEAALAAVSGLSDMVAEREAAEQARIARAEAEAQAKAEAIDRVRHPERYFPVPPRLLLKRGGLASVVPGLVLIALGVWLTFSYTTQNVPSGDVLAAALTGGAALIFLSRWLASGRWSQGALFFALTLLLAGGVVLTSAAFPDGLADAWPLLAAASGVAIMLAGLLSRPAERRLFFPGLALVVAGGVGLLVMLGTVPADVLTALAAWWPLPLVVVIVLLILPRFNRQRR